MSITYLITRHDIAERKDDDTSPILGIVLKDLNNSNEYGMSKQLKDFSLAMQKYGLAWSERYNRGENIVTEEERVREQSQSYYTQNCSVQYLQAFIHSNLNISDTLIILDPAAGTGNLIDGLNVPRNLIWAVEPDAECCQILHQKGYEHVINTDFETAVANNLIPRPTHIIMNPPFSKQQDIKFYNLACRLLKDGGVVSAIISENSIYEELSKYGLTLDCNNSKRQAIEILKSKYASGLSNHLREFLENIATSEWISLDDVTSEFGFENTDARAFFVREIVREREKKRKLPDHDEDEGR